jgi:hypothetical protein
MRRLCTLITLLTAQSLVIAGQSVVYEGDLSPLNILPTFDKGYLAVYEPEDAISLYGPDGRLAYKATVQAPSATLTVVHNASPGSDGSLAVTVDYGIEKEKFLRGGIAFFNNVGKQTAFIDTGSDYFPTQVCFGADHSIWAIVWRGLDAPKTSTADYFVLRNYARDGRLLGAFLPRSSFEQEVVGPMTGGWQLRSVNGRIGAMIYASSAVGPGERPVPQWIETDFHGNIVRQVDIPQRNIQAFSNNGSLYARRYSGGYVVFDAATKSWRTVAGHPVGSLLGADENKLVFLVGDNTLVWLGQQ